MKILTKYYSGNNEFTAITNHELDANDKEYRYELLCTTDNGIKWKAFKIYEYDTIIMEEDEIPSKVLQLAIDAKHSIDKEDTLDYVIYLFSIFELDKARKISENLIDDIMTDIEESADQRFNNTDIKLALQRVLMKRLNIDE